MSVDVIRKTKKLTIEVEYRVDQDVSEVVLLGRHPDTTEIEEVEDVEIEHVTFCDDGTLVRWRRGEPGWEVVEAVARAMVEAARR
jgi:hypothetical protein